MSQKCPDVLPTSRVTAYLAELPDQLFELELRAHAAVSSGVETEAADVTYS